MRQHCFNEVRTGQDGGNETPDCEKWPGDVQVSLTGKVKKEIPSGFSPRCPRHSDLLLCRNSLRKIPNSFFEQLNEPKILDLSYSDIEELPNSISDLENLRVFVLSHCIKLRHLLSLLKLKALKKLDLSDCRSVEMIPQDIRFLSNLRHLDFCGTRIKEFPAGILPLLVNLHVLKLSYYLKVEELAFLRKLEVLTCYFHHVGELKTLPCTLYFYTLVVGELDSWSDVRDVVELHDRNLVIYNCSETEYFLSLSSSYPSLFQSIQHIYLRNLKEENAAATLPLSLPDSKFSRLEKFYIGDCCPSMKKLFPPGLVSNFRNLEIFDVSNCDEMEEIIATEEEHRSIQFALPKVKWFSLRNLPNLKSICSGAIICNSLQDIRIINCEKLNRVALSLFVTNSDNQLSHLPSLKGIRVFPQEWWEGVELVHPNPQTILSPLCQLSED